MGASIYPIRLNMQMVVFHVVFDACFARELAIIMYVESSAAIPPFKYPEKAFDWDWHHVEETFCLFQNTLQQCIPRKLPQSNPIYRSYLLLKWLSYPNPYQKPILSHHPNGPPTISEALIQLLLDVLTALLVCSIEVERCPVGPER